MKQVQTAQTSNPQMMMNPGARGPCKETVQKHKTKGDCPKTELQKEGTENRSTGWR